MGSTINIALILTVVFMIGLFSFTEAKANPFEATSYILRNSGHYGLGYPGRLTVQKKIYNAYNEEKFYNLLNVLRGVIQEATNPKDTSSIMSQPKYG